MKHRCLSLLLVAALLAGFSPVWQTAADAQGVEHLIIHQVYGTAANIDGAISTSFVELYNPTDAPISMAGWSLQYAAAGTAWTKLSLSATIPAHTSYLIVCNGAAANASARYVIAQSDLTWEGQQLHNKTFKLALVNHDTLLTVANPTTDVVDLVGTGSADFAEGTAFDGLSKQKAGRRIAFADTDDNSADFESLDYREANMTAAQLAAARPRCLADGVWGGDVVPENERLVFSQVGGLYTSGFALSLTSGYTDAAIYYTTDGSEPTTGKTRYTAALNIADRTSQANDLSAITNIGYDVRVPQVKVFKGTVVKARVFDSGGAALTPVVTHSYFINAAIATRYGVPVISLSTDRKHFFDNSTGIYVNYNQSGAEWERPLYMEYFDKDGALQLSQGAGVRIHGGYTRGMAQKTLRLYAKSEYDSKNTRFAYDLFNGSALDSDGNAINSFKRILLRNSGNDNTSTMFRDVFMQSLFTNMHNDHQASSQCVVFLNGEYWGVYNIRERYDNEYIASHYNIDKDDVAMLTFNFNCNNVPELDEGDQTDVDYYNQMYSFFSTAGSFALAANYEQATRYLDPDSLIDHFISHTFVNNTDWPGNNNVMWRYKAADGGYDPTAPYGLDGRWRWMIKDTDGGFTTNGGYNDTLLGRVMQPGSQWLASWSTLFFRRLLENPGFKASFINRYCDLLNTNFKPDVIAAALQSTKAKYVNIMAEEMTRYQNISSMTSWNNNTEYMQTFGQNRPAAMYNQLSSLFGLSTTAQQRIATVLDQGTVSLNGMPLKPGVTPGVGSEPIWTGAYYPGYQQTVSATALPGYAFSHFKVTLNGVVTNTTDNPYTFAASPSGILIEPVYNEYVKETVSTPYADVADGHQFRGTLPVTLSCATPGAVIHYTLDGSDPTADSPVYAEPLVLTDTTTLKAMAVKTDYNDSGVAAFTYTLLPPVPVQSITVTGATSVTVGATSSYTADVQPADAADKTILWGVIDGTGSATITSDGVLTGVSAGSVTVVATAQDGSDVSASKAVTITAPVAYPNNIFVTKYGKGSVSCTQTGKQAAYTFTPAADHKVVGVRINGLLRSATGGTTFADCTTAATLVVVFGKTDGSDAPGFTDTTTHWAVKDINFTAANQIVGGTGGGKFSPNSPTTRAMIATLISRIYSADLSGYTTDPFIDVTAITDTGNWYGKHVAWAADTKIVGGVGNNRFDPNGNVTRQQLAAMLFRFATYIKLSNVTSRAPLSAFPDAATVQPYAVEALQWAVAANIIGGDGGRLNPNGLATRAQVATMLARFIRQAP